MYKVVITSLAVDKNLVIIGSHMQSNVRSCPISMQQNITTVPELNILHINLSFYFLVFFGIMYLDPRGILFVLLYQCANLLYYNHLVAEIQTGYLSDLCVANVSFVDIVTTIHGWYCIGWIASIQISPFISNIVECCLVWHRICISG